jgi:hypothetical protein
MWLKALVRSVCNRKLLKLSTEICPSTKIIRLGIHCLYPAWGNYSTRRSPLCNQTTNHEMIHHEPLINVAVSSCEQHVQQPARVHVQPNLLINKDHQLIYALGNQIKIPFG